MKRTICSSLLFSLPAQLASYHRDGWMMNGFLSLMATSLILHSHTFHPDRFRRRLFSLIDQLVVWLMTVTTTGLCLWTSPTVCCALHLAVTLSLAAYLTFDVLQFKPIEQYTSYQKNMHVLLHLVGAVGFTSTLWMHYYV